MRLVKLSEFRRMRYAFGSRPCIKTLRQRIHEIPGGRIEHGHYYVDMDENDRANRLTDTIAERQKAVEPLLEGLI